jgi:hypothetical protein
VIELAEVIKQPVTGWRLAGIAVGVGLGAVTLLGLGDLNDFAAAAALSSVEKFGSVMTTANNVTEATRRTRRTREIFLGFVVIVFLVVIMIYLVVFGAIKIFVGFGVGVVIFFIRKVGVFFRVGMSCSI